MTSQTVFGGGTSNCTNVFNSSTTVYRLIGSGDSRGTETSTETNRRVSPTVAATVSKLWMYSSVNSHTAALTFSSRNNGSAGNLTISVTALTTGAFSDDTHSDSYTSNLTYDIAQTIGASDAFHAYTCTQWSLLWDVGASNPVNIICSVSDEGSQGASTTSYNQFVGGGSNSPGYFGHTTEDGQVQMEVRNSGATFRRLQTFISSSTTSNAGTINFRKNGSNGNNTLSITAATTGRFTDSTDTDPGLVNTDKINWSWITGAGTSNAVIEYVAGQLNSTGGSTAWDMFAGQGYTGAGSQVSTSSDTYLNTLGCFTQSFTTTEANAQTRIPIAAKASHIRIYLAAAGSGTQTLTFRNNGAGGNGTASVTSGTTGLFEDSTNTDTLSANDLICLKLTHPSSGTCVPSRAAVLLDSTVLNSYTLAIPAGSYTWAGVAAGLDKGYYIAPVAGAYAWSRVSAALDYARKFAIPTGSYSVSGKTTGLLVGRKGAPVAGVYTWTGVSAGLSGVRTMSVSNGVYTISGKPTGLLVGRKITATQGSYVYGDVSAALVRGYKIPALTGTYTVSGQAVSFGRSRFLAAQAGVYLIDGQDAVLVPSFHYHVSFAELSDDTFKDWGTADFTSYMAISQSDESIDVKEQTPYIYTFLKETSTSDADSEGAMMTGFWDWANDTSSPRVSTPTEIYKFRNGFLVSATKHKLRGRGRQLQLRFDSESGKNFNLLGWAVFYVHNAKQ